MIASGYTKRQMEAIKSDGCTCQWYTGDGWERDYRDYVRDAITYS